MLRPENRLKKGQACPACGFQDPRADGAASAEDPQVFAAKAALCNQIVAHLAAAPFPIRDSDELRAAFDPEVDFEFGGIHAGSEALVRLVSERDFLFTTPRQVANVLAQRALAEYSPGRLAAFGQEQLQAAAHVHPVGQEPSSDRKRILAIDDEPTIRELLRLVLADQGYEVTVAADGRSGLAKAVDAPPDLAIVDFSMPDMKGDEVLRALKQERPGLRSTFSRSSATSLRGRNSTTQTAAS